MARLNQSRLRLRAMKAVATGFVLLCVCWLGQAQSSATNGIFFLTTPSTLTSISNAVKIASGLRVGMPATDVRKYMDGHGMSQTNVYALSLDRGRTMTCPYPLAGSATLMLDMHCTSAPPGLFGWSNPVLDRAYIQSQGTSVISITFTNRP